jgi:hypothetical protein
MECGACAAARTTRQGAQVVARGSGCGLAAAEDGRSPGGIRLAPPPACAEASAVGQAALGARATCWFIESYLFLPDLLIGREPENGK